MLGDSITFGWQGAGRATYDAWFVPRRIEAFGIDGDRTADLLSRIEGGELAGAEARVVALLIGTNDLDCDTPAAASAGIHACARAAREAAPEATIVVLGLLPRGIGGPEEPVRRAIREVNAALEALHDGRRTHVLDVGAAFLDADGRVERALFESDCVHLSALGYAVLQREIAPTFEVLLA